MTASAKGKHSKAIHGGYDPLEHRGGASMPIYQSSTFVFPSVEEGAARFDGSSPGLIYTRLGNPTIAALEECVSALEGGCGAVAVATGMAAVSTVLLATLSAGDTVVGTHPVYGPTKLLIENHFTRLGVQAVFVPAADPAALEEAVTPDTRLVLVETPANPTLDIVDLAAAAEAAHRVGALLAVDSTFASPHLQRPMEHGADIVFHSMTKFLNGHSDVVAGIVVARDRGVLARLREIARSFGCTMDPHQAWLVLRGIRTLGMRVERAQATAKRLATWLEGHPEVAWVRYPGLASHPQRDVARRQMDGPGAMVTFELRGGLEAGKVLMNSVRLVTLAVSLGGVESLIEHPASMTHAKVPADEQLRQGITPGLVRLAVGCEDADDLAGDLAQALDQVTRMLPADG